jgi:hypothetical protein
MQVNSAANTSQMYSTQVDSITNRAFSKLDPSNKGSFDKASFEKLFSQMSGGNPASTAIADKIFQKLDANGTGQVDKAEFANDVSSFMNKIHQGGGLQSLLGGSAVGGLQSLMGGGTSSSDSSSDGSTSTNPIDMFMQALDSNNPATSNIQSTQDYLNTMQKQKGS